MKVKCPICGAIVGAHIPGGGDGTGVFPVRHPRGARAHKECDGTYAIVPIAAILPAQHTTTDGSTP